MRINTALILCAGFGKRLNPITLKTPKPLLKIKGATLLDHCINLIVDLNLKKVLINSFHLKEQIHKFVKNHNYNIEIKVIDDGDRILDTGGGVLNLINNSNDEDFLIFNPDTLWKKEYLKEISQMIDIYFNEKLKNILLLVNKDLSFDEKLKSLKPPIFWKDKTNFINQAKIWDKKKIKIILKKTYEIEKKIKSNSFINKNILVKKLILDICECANS